MWIAGIVLLLLLGAGLIAVIGWVPRVRTGPAVWDLPGASGIYSSLVYTLAGFSVAAATFLAGVSSARDSPAFATVTGLLLLSFLVLMAASMMYGATPERLTPAEKPDQIVALWTVLANGVYLIGLALNWFALAPLLQVIELPALATALGGPLLIVAVAGSLRLALVTYRLTMATVRACLAMPLLGVALPAGYRLLATAAWPALWPATEAPLRFAMVAFVTAALGFFVQTSLLLAGEQAAPHQQWLRQNAHRVALLYLQVAAIVIGLVGFAVVIG